MIRKMDERRYNYGAVVNEFNKYVRNFESFVNDISPDKKTEIRSPVNQKLNAKKLMEEK